MGILPIRARFNDQGLEPYDCLNPDLMDHIATCSVQNRAQHDRFSP